ncbi:uncharacterized protein MELLADRAFT_72808 [Melampsora larici-populina 98AG31]|uniref:Secreted protein n=1 Tax=Melampsora larici-populina (strain 98AG31 / pathotype 3-4-7) TaxID=747676 RepID=F4RZ54_MELLP|nr:uncharacterized protein MELLADRAFT_72808 [Melampsora larici-populina 98AG31]EGG02375.1 secreted protein [Melampsora larici-populina 98AG31]
MNFSVMNLHSVSLVLMILLAMNDLMASPVPTEYTQSTQSDAVSGCYSPVPQKEKHHHQYSAPISYGSDQGSNSSDYTDEVENSASKINGITLDSTLELDSNIKQKLTKEKYARPPPYKRSLVESSKLEKSRLI